MKIKDIMIKNVVSVGPETSVLKAAELLTKNSFSGVPVVDSQNKVIGILTEYDLIIKGSRLHMPTFIALLQKMDVHRKDKPELRDDLIKIMNLKVKDIMNDDPLTLNREADVEEAVIAFAEHHRVNPIPIVDNLYRLTGILSRYDVIKYYAPFSPLEADTAQNERDLDARVNGFVGSFQKKFVLVTKFRTRWWLVISLSFLVIGFLAALFLMIRIVINQ